MKKYSFIIFLLVFIWVAVSSPAIAIDPVTTVSPEPTTDPNAFVIPPFPVLEIPSPVKSCELKTSRDETIYPPNSACYAEVKRTQLRIKDYPKTCIKEPYVTYSDIRGVDHNRVPEGDNSWATCLGVSSVKYPPCNVYITVTTDVSKAELGSYGPNYETLADASTSADMIAQKYLFNAVFDRPYYSMPNTPREAWRTYWRLLPFNEQANLTAQFINLVFLNQPDDLRTLKKINNTQYQYINANGGISTTTVKDVANRLPDCLKIEPVCPDFAFEYNNLNPDTKAAYDTLIPLSFNNLRGWIALAPPSFPPRDGVPQTVSRESLPYIEPIFSGLLSSKYGLLANLQPSWLIATSLTGLTDSNTGYALSGKDGYISGQFDPNKQLFKDGGADGADSSLDPIVLDNADIVRCPDYPDVYHLSAPYTYPKNPQNKDPFHIQEVQILGSTLDWEIDHPDVIETCTHETGCDQNGENCSGCDRWAYSCNSPAEICSKTSYGGGDQECCQFKVTGSGIGKALTVFNNPKVTDIKKTVVGDTTSSLYNTLIPDALLTPTPTDMKIDAPTSTHMEINTDYSGNGAVSNTTNPIFRENNLAQDTMHLIQNCWLIPGDNQKSSKCGVNEEKPEETKLCPKVDDSAVDGKYLGAFKANFIDLANRWSGKCPGAENNLADECYNYVASEAKSAGVNPAFALTIWLNESDASNYCHGGPTTQDMGINLPSLYQDLPGQLEVFLNMANTKLCEGVSGYTEPMQGWLSRFQSSSGKCDPSDSVAMKYYSLIKDQSWLWITGCSSSGKFGITWPTDMSCP